MYLWIDDLREPPKIGANWLWARTVSEAKTAIMFWVVVILLFIAAEISVMNDKI